MAVTPDKDDLCIREVWADNLDAEMDVIRRVVNEFPFVAMDTEFPGTVLKPVSVSRGDPSYNYLSLKANVNTLKLIQLGLTFSDAAGSLPMCETEAQPDDGDGDEDDDGSSSAPCLDFGSFSSALPPKPRHGHGQDKDSSGPASLTLLSKSESGQEKLSGALAKCETSKLDKSRSSAAMLEAVKMPGLQGSLGSGSRTMCETRLDELGFSLGCETRQENRVEENKLKKSSEKKKKKKKKYCIWQFNFCEFSPLEDVCACESIDLLRRAGIDFNKFKRNGITFARFGEVFMSSGVVLNPEVHWITFHCAYDIGYLLRVLTSKKLPELESDFMNVVRVFFPTLYDIKYMMKFHALHGSLTNLAISLGVDRLGESHQAGSDSLLTSCVFREIKETYCNGSTEQYAGVLYGLGVDSLSY